MFKRFCMTMAATAFCAVFSGMSPAMAGVAVVSPLPVTVTEGISGDPGSFQIEYTVTNHDSVDNPLDPDGIMGFAIDFGIPEGFSEQDLGCSTPNNNWTCTFADAASWDGGIGIPGLTIADTEELLSTADLFFNGDSSFADFFGPDATNVVIFSNFSSDDDIGPGETLGGFIVNGQQLQLSSTAVVLCEGNFNVCATQQATGVPEPGALGLLGIGLLGLGAVRYRRYAG